MKSVTASSGGALGLRFDVLADGHALVTGQDVLQPLHSGVLAGDRHLTVETVPLEYADIGVGDAVVGDVVVGVTIEGEPVVVDRPDARSLGLGEHRLARR
ncbi:hypothetical protein [Streptomyces sp. LUP47B]|uniref:hypothetical protein n=1 Tax=Streptomyces sp. LUP47B TaxID=1890286 RepID=UPI00114C9150|nr:hypothetical protein [Streptomyces sp. LUP47B]